MLGSWNITGAAERAADGGATCRDPGKQGTERAISGIIGTILT